ncbi:11743_t:CDS:1, partial [Acaulospora colombiana]
NNQSNLDSSTGDTNIIQKTDTNSIAYSPPGISTITHLNNSTGYS